MTLIGPLHDPITWYGINYVGRQITQWDFKSTRKSGWTGKNSFVLEVPLRYLRPSIIYSVPCDRIIGHYRNVRGLGKSMVVFRLFEKLRYSKERSTIF